MSRRKRALVRSVKPDTRYQNAVLGKFINHLMLHGKKLLAESIVYDAFKIIEEQTKQEPLEVFQSALENVAPEIEVRSRRVGGSNYQIPTPVKEARSMTLCMRWIIAASRAGSSNGIAPALAKELMDASKQRGSAFKKKEDVRKMAEANRAFAHFRW